MRISRTLLRSALTLLSLYALPLQSRAQTYTPRQILIEGPAGMDKADILRASGLTEGTPLTKEQIEAGLGRLGDTGDFTDLGYTVNSDALILKLTPSPSAQILPVRYTNFVWWTPEELTLLIQARVPLYQGKLPLKGNLTGQVEAALVAILKQKGIDDPSVTLIEALGGGRFALAISHPVILLRDIDVHGSLHVVSGTLAKMQAGFAGQEFDLQLLTKAIPQNVTDIYYNAGYLDATADPATFKPPVNLNNEYMIDASTTVHPGEPYRIGKLTFDAPPPLSAADAEKSAGVKTGDIAGAFTLQHAADSLAHAYYMHGFLDAKTAESHPTDPTTHTADCTFSVTPGDIYHLAGISVSTLPPNLQAAFANNPKLAPGVIADDTVLQEISRILNSRQASHVVSIGIKADHSKHLAVVVLKPSAAKP